MLQVGNAKDFTFADWQENIIQASHAHINGFALNMAADWEHNDDSLKLAFPAAMSLGFKLIFSFDYAGGGPWDKATVTRMIQDWGKHPAYWQHDGKPLVSTFEGPGNAADWHDIKAATNCFFMPDWSSEGAGPALQLAGGVADGLFSWAAWPWANRDVDTYTDHSYTQALGGKPYMMAVSPWFFTNLPGYNKNWLWWGGNLWYERWQQTLDIKPDYVQIISWNDFGESHHIGPLDPKQYEAFQVGEAPYNYVQDHSHEGWLQHLPFMIDTYLGKNPTFDTESAVIVHQVTWAEKCHAGGTTGNTASQLQAEYPPEDISHDNLYIAALLTSPSDLYVTHGEGGPVTVVKADKWDISPDGGVGLYYTTVPMKAPGKQTVNLKRVVVGSQSETVTRDETLSSFVDGACNSLVAANWNAKMAWKSWSPWEKKEYRHKVDLKDRVCTKGWGWGDFHSICQYTCSYGYCPDSCVCTNMGAQREKPEPAYEVGYPKNGDANFQGLCNVAVNLGG
ncbi:glycosyl hydrolase family 71-domain-containing protein, partial [Paraphoma chrysanthemicola]